jgi:hypothetical protein
VLLMLRDLSVPRTRETMDDAISLHDRNRVEIVDMASTYVRRPMVVKDKVVPVRF